MAAYDSIFEWPLKTGFTVSLISVVASNAEICRYCGVRFQNKSSLRQHEGRHIGKGLYQWCGKPFFSKANLKRHMCHKHGDLKPFQSCLCQKAFATNTDLQRHMRKQKKEGLLTCEVCNQKFSTKENLTEHLDKHSGVKEHKCGICGHSFR